MCERMEEREEEEEGCGEVVVAQEVVGRRALDKGPSGGLDAVDVAGKGKAPSRAVLDAAAPGRTFSPPAGDDPASDGVLGIDAAGLLAFSAPSRSSPSSTSSPCTLVAPVLALHRAPRARCASPPREGAKPAGAPERGLPGYECDELLYEVVEAVEAERVRWMLRGGRGGVVGLWEGRGEEDEEAVDDVAALGRGRPG